MKQSSKQPSSTSIEPSIDGIGGHTVGTTGSVAMAASTTTTGGGGGGGDLITNDIIEFQFKKLEFNIDELYDNQFSSFLHIPLPNAINRVDNGSLILGELCKIFQVIFLHGFH